MYVGKPYIIRCIHIYEEYGESDKIQKIKRFIADDTKVLIKDSNEDMDRRIEEFSGSNTKYLEMKNDPRYSEAINSIPPEYVQSMGQTQQIFIEMKKNHEEMLRILEKDIINPPISTKSNWREFLSEITDTELHTSENLLRMRRNADRVFLSPKMKNSVPYFQRYFIDRYKKRLTEKENQRDGKKTSTNS